MASPRFLFDEDVSRLLAKALRGKEPTIDILCVAEPGGPTIHTNDPEMLDLGESLDRILVSNDRSTMPVHIQDHFAKGSHTWGVVLLRQGFSSSRYIQDMLLIWQATSADEWLDRTDYIPY